jgi:hypothetical protein
MDALDLGDALLGSIEARHRLLYGYRSDFMSRRIYYVINDKRGPPLIVRSPHPGHGRVIMTELTKAGQKAVAEGAKAADVVERQMLSMLSAEEAGLLCELLKRCAAALDEEPPDS